MTSQCHPVPTSFLRRVLLADAARQRRRRRRHGRRAPGRSQRADRPAGALLLAVAGLSLLPYAAFLAWLATRAHVPRAAAWAPVLLNVVWAVDCIDRRVRQADAPSRSRPAFLAVQAVTVLDLRRARVRRHARAQPAARRLIGSPRGRSAARAIGYRCAAWPACRTSAAAAPRSRFDRLDALRGVAIVWMAAFHFASTSTTSASSQQNFYSDPFWTLQRTCIVTLFLFCAGAGQEIACHQGQPLAALLAALGAGRRLRAAGERSARGSCSRAAGSASACCTASR